MELDMALQRIMDSISNERMTELICQLVSIPSVTGQEHAIGDMLYDLFGQMGLSDVQRVPVEDSGDGLVAKISGAPNGPVMMLNFHQDTFDVCDDWTTDSWTPVLQDGCIYGLRTRDMKAGGAAILSAVESLTQAGVELGGTLLISTTTDEENWSRGAHAVLNSGLIDGGSACLIPEHTPPGRLRIGSRGQHVIKIELIGKTAHAAYSGEGINAVTDAARIITALDQLELAWNEYFELGGSLWVIKVSGGQNILLVPEQAQLLIDRHILPSQAVEKAVQYIDALIQTLPIASEYKITWNDLPTPASAPYIVDEQSAFVQSTKTRVEEQSGQAVTLRSGAQCCRHLPFCRNTRHSHAGLRA
jgi:succinyl-diaminopimelate desuccinylase